MRQSNEARDRLGAVLLGRRLLELLMNCADECVVKFVAGLRAVLEELRYL